METDRQSLRAAIGAARTPAKFGRICRPHVFEPAPGRLVWLPVHLASSSAAAASVVRAAPPWYVGAARAPSSPGTAGAASASSPTRRCTTRWSRAARLEKVVGFVGFLPYCLSPTLWTAWHNQAHHGNTGKPVADPDGYRHARLLAEERASSARWRRSRPAPASRAAPLFLFVWFSIHSLLVLVFHSRRNGYYARVSRRAVYARVGRDGGLLDRRARAGRAVRLPVPVRAAAARRERGGHVVHRDEPLPEPAHRGERSARQHSLGHEPAMARAAASAVRLPRRAPPLPDDERPPCARRCATCSCASTATGT